MSGDFARLLQQEALAQELCLMADERCCSDECAVCVFLGANR